MRRPAWILALSMATLSLEARVAAQVPSILEPKVERHEGPPLWISAEAVLDAERIINLDLIDSTPLRQEVEKQRLALGDRLPAEKLATGGKPKITRIPPSECKSETYLEDYRAGDGPSVSLRDLASHSKSIVRGHVRAVELGFSFGTPSSLLSVEVADILKGPARPKSPLYIDYPVARFKIGPYSFCNATKGYEPQPGDEILLFDVAGPTDRTGALYVPRMDQIFFQSRNGALSLPANLKSTEDLKTADTLKDVISRLRSQGLAG